MENEPPPIENPPPRGGGKICFLLLALLPIPMGLLADPLRLFDIAQGDKTVSSSPLIVLNVFTVICCVTGGIGMCGGFKKGNWMGLISGLVVGLIFWPVVASVVLFIGCCIGLSHVH
jgi:hypothetical protein